MRAPWRVLWQGRRVPVFHDARARRRWRRRRVAIMALCAVLAIAALVLLDQEAPVVAFVIAFVGAAEGLGLLYERESFRRFHYGEQ